MVQLSIEFAQAHCLRKLMFERAGASTFKHPAHARTLKILCCLRRFLVSVYTDYIG